ncbi:MAG: hypothetical protein AAFW89_06880 [Bacteroidota bacterium]
MPEIVLPEVELNIHTPKAPSTARVVENYICTASSSPNIVRHITFDISDTDIVNRIRAGQSIGILPPGVNEKGKPHKLRLYSVSSPTAGENGNPNHVSTTVKRVMEEWEGKLYTGVGSNYLCDLQPGDELEVAGPSGKRFLLPENSHDFNYVFFATGTGIAPFRGMIIELLEQGYTGNIALVFGCAYRTDILYSDFLAEMTDRYPNFSVVNCISRENPLPDGSKKYVQAAIIHDQEVLSPILKQDNTLIYICGMKGMEVGIYHNLAKLGFTDYLDIRGDFADQDPNEWDWKLIKKQARPSARTFEEVY